MHTRGICQLQLQTFLQLATLACYSSWSARGLCPEQASVTTRRTSLTVSTQEDHHQMHIHNHITFPLQSAWALAQCLGAGDANTSKELKAHTMRCLRETHGAMRYALQVQLIGPAVVSGCMRVAQWQRHVSLLLPAPTSSSSCLQGSGIIQQQLPHPAGHPSLRT